MRKKFIVPIVIWILAVVVIIGIVVHKNKAGSKVNESDATYTELNEAAMNIEKEYATEGYVKSQDVSDALDKLEELAKQYKKNGFVSDYQRQNTSIYFKLTSGIGYLYSLSMEGLLTGSSQGNILTIEPGAKKGDFIENYEFVGINPDEVAEKIAEQFPNNYSFSEEDNWDTLTFEQIQDMGSYEIIIWYGHGGYTEEHGPVLATSVPVNEEMVELYLSELKNGEMVLTKDYFCVTPSYFENHIRDGALDGSLVFLAACESVRDERLANVFIDKGADLVVGSTERIHVNYLLNMMDDFVTSLANQYDDNTYWTAEDALDYAKAQNGAKDNGYYAEIQLNYSENIRGYRLYGEYDTDGIHLGNDNEDTDSGKSGMVLSGDCDKVLASATNSNNDYYELVANETETYAGVVVEVGVIKNNQWLLEPISVMPLVDDDKTLYGTSITGLDNAPKTIYYIGNNCFLYRTVYSWGWSGKTYQEIVYNVETGKYYELIEVGEIDSNYPTVIAYEDYSIISENKFYDNGMKVHVSDEGLVVWQAVNYDRSGVVITLLNTTTMQTQEVTLGNCGPDPKCYPISEGWFAITNFYGDFKFYDTTGQMVLDLSEYDLTHDEQPLFFVDGKCTFTIYNNNNNIYKITVDKNGNVTESSQQ